MMLALPSYVRKDLNHPPWGALTIFLKTFAHTIDSTSPARRLFTQPLSDKIVFPSDRGPSTVSLSPRMHDPQSGSVLSYTVLYYPVPSPSHLISRVWTERSGGHPSLGGPSIACQDLRKPQPRPSFSPPSTCFVYTFCTVPIPAINIATATARVSPSRVSPCSHCHCYC